jgi:multiple sugar transport system substrate-binding protein
MGEARTTHEGRSARNTQPGEAAEVLSRRSLLHRAAALGAGAFGASLMAACQQPAQPSPTPAPAAAAVSALPYKANQGLTGEITFWHFWGSPVRRNAIRRVINSFQQEYPGIKVNETFVPFGEIWTKNLAAVAAGSGMPDVIVEDRPQLKDRARNNIDIDLGDLARRDGIDGKEFWPFTWEEATVNGSPYGLPYETDIRVLYWNKAAFKDAGLDPETPPRDWDDLWAFAEKLDNRDADGKLERAAFYPLFGNISLESWAWNNGGEWMTRDGKFTINRPENVEALAWIKKWTDRYGKANWDAFQGTFGQGLQEGFMSGRVVMVVDIAGYSSFLNFYNPNMSTASKERLGWGVGSIPPAPGKKPASHSGGFALSIPRGVKNVDQGWEFIKYAAFVGQASWARDTYAIPTLEKLAREDPTLNGDPNWKVFVEAMSYGRPTDFNERYPRWMDVLLPARDAVLNGQMSPQEALDEAQAKAEAEAARAG